MKITMDRTGGDIHITVEREPMPPEWFATVCRLARTTIIGGVLLGAIALVGFWVIPWSVGALVAAGVYRLMKEGL